MYFDDDDDCDKAIVIVTWTLLHCWLSGSDDKHKYRRIVVAIARGSGKSF